REAKGEIRRGRQTFLRDVDPRGRRTTCRRRRSSWKRRLLFRQARGRPRSFETARSAWEGKMKVLILAFGIALTATSALAQTIQPADAKKHVGQTVTVEGAVSDVHTAASGTTFIDMGGRYPDSIFTVVIFKDDASKFPDV